MKPVTGFLADNGKFFEDAQECAEYEQFINLRKAVTFMRPQDYGLSGTGNANETLTKFVLDLAESNPHLIAGIAEGSMPQQPEHQPEPETRMPDLAVMADVIVEASEPEDLPVDEELLAQVFEPFEPTHTIISSGERVMYRGVIDGDRSEVECVSGNIIAVQALDLKTIPNPKLKKWLNQPA